MLTTHPLLLSGLKSLILNMKMEHVPGYKQIFNDKSKSYEEWLTNIPSETVIYFIIRMNTEINGPAGSRDRSHISKLLHKNYTYEQRVALDKAFGLYGNNGNPQEKSFFARWYLMTMLLRELERNITGIPVEPTSDQMFRMLMAYLQVIDDKHDYNERLSSVFSEAKDEMTKYRLLWIFSIEQFEFNQDVNPIFELIRLYSFLRYSHEHFKPYLKEYLNQNGLKSIGQLISSYRQIIDVTLHYNPADLLQRMSYLRPSFGTNIRHLQTLSINSLFGKQNLGIGSIRRYPLFQTFKNDFMVIDRDMGRRKIFKGPFFELRSETSLKGVKDFNDYSSEVSGEVMEKMFFRGICKLMRKPNHDIFYFDDNSISLPDLYIRMNRKIIMIEYKDTIFKEELITNPNFEEIKKYIDERFVVSQRSKPKGISQLINQIGLLFGKQFQFDPGVLEMLEQGKPITIYPILCYSDFMFSMPGVNKYINDLFKNQLEGKSFPNLEIKPITMLNLERLFDYSLKRGNFQKFLELVDRYWHILRNREQLNRTQFSANNFIREHASFDEIYNSIFFKELPKINLGMIDKLPDLSSLTQSQINEEL